MLLLYLLLIFFGAATIGLLAILLSKKIDFSLKYYTANRESTKLAADPHQHSEAIIQVYAARAFNWRGLFSVHTWITFKAKNAAHYEVFQVVGWRKYRGLHCLSKETDIPDRAWYGQVPKIILDIRGKKAEKLIPKIITAADAYPYQGYQMWPGPNSNTFTAFVGRKVPGLSLVMPANAMGKDYLGRFTFISRPPSRTGLQISFWGIFGFIIALREGIEVNFLSLILGINPRYLMIKIPCLGDIGLIKLG